MDSHVYKKDKLFSEIGRNKPDVVVMDLDLYATMDGIEASRRIRNSF
jgi:CheY-like chemotaxis protein